MRPAQGWPQFVQRPPDRGGGKGIGIKIAILFALLAMGKIASLAQRGAVGSPELRLAGIVMAQVGLLVLAVLNVDFVFYVFLFYLPFSEMLPGDYGTAVNITNVLIVIVVLGLFCRSVRDGGHFFVRTELDRLIGAYLFFIFISFLRSSLSETMDWVLLVTLVKRFYTPIMLYYLTSWVIRRRDEIKDSMFVIMLTTFMVSFLATKDTTTPTHFSWERRESAVINQANILAAFFVYYMFYFFSYAKTYIENKKSLLLLPCLYPCARGIMLTYSRGGYIGFAVCLIFISFLWKKSLGVIVAIMVLIVWFKPASFLPGSVVERIDSTVIKEEGVYGTTQKTVEVSAGSRLDIWRGGASMIMSNPILGVGYGQFPRLIGNYAPGMADRDAHNSYVLIAAEMGIPTLIIFMWFTIRLFRDSLLIYRYSRDRLYSGIGMGYATGIVGFWVTNMFGCRFNTVETISYFWILAAMITLVKRMALQPQPTAP